MPVEQGGSMHASAAAAPATMPRLDAGPVAFGPPPIRPEAVTFFTPGQMKLLTERPMPNLFLSELASMAGDTEYHELNHALSDPENVVAISVQPQGNILGYTLFGRIPDAATTAAGMIDTPMGKASGTSGDAFQLKARAILSGIHPETMISGAKKEAANRLSQIPDGIKHLLAKALAIRGKISGSEFRQLKKQAEWEFQWNSLFPHLTPVFIKSQLKLKTTTLQPVKEINGKPVIPQFGKYILVVDNANGITEITEYSDGKQVGKTIFKCRACGGEGGHFKGCAANPENTNNNVFVRNVAELIDGLDIFPPAGLIFDGKISD